MTAERWNQPRVPLMGRRVKRWGPYMLWEVTEPEAEKEIIAML